jgi:hypothetical protein
MPRDGREEVRWGQSLPGVARAVVLASPDPEVVGHVFELDAQWPKLILSSEAVLAREDDGWWVETSGDVLGTWIDGRRLSPGDSILLTGGEVVTVGGAPDPAGRATGGSVLLFDSTPEWSRRSGVWGTTT